MAFQTLPDTFPNGLTSLQRPDLSSPLSGDLTRALDFFGRGLSIRAKVQGPMHRDTATAVDNVAQVYR